MSMNGLAGAISGAGGLAINGPDANAQKQIKEACGARSNLQLCG